MPSLSTFLSLAHLLGLALGVGASSVKLTLLVRCTRDPGFVPAYLEVVSPITRVIILGLALLTLSGIGWLLVVGGYAFTPGLIFKLLLVGAIWVIGPVIDNVVEPRYRASAPVRGEPPSPAFLQAQRRYLSLEFLATGIFYVITAFWVLG